ncbi:MAG TPA: hypothetical protein PLV43_09090 [Aequorivita sp.]|nr:hypothetical protein [Aequorivita sp.]
MKKTILSLTILSALLIGCKETKHKHESADIVESTEGTHEHQMEEMPAGAHSMSNAWVNEINLNNGNKWEANLETTEGVDKMLNMVKSSDPKTVEEYHTLASILNEEKNIVVKKCTMKGPSHDNLHVFLHPLIDKIEALGKVTTTDEGSETMASIKENLEGYYNYFK